MNTIGPDWPQRKKISPRLMQAARHIVIASIRAIVAEEAGNGMVDLRDKIDVRCEEDDTGFTVAFIDAFDLLLPPEGP